MSKRNERPAYIRPVIDEREARQARQERRRILAALEVAAELAKLGIEPERVWQRFGFRPYDVERWAAFDPEVRKARKALDTALSVGQKAPALVARSMFQKVWQGRSWRPAAWLLKHAYLGHTLLRPETGPPSKPEGRGRPNDLAAPTDPARAEAERLKLLLRLEAAVELAEMGLPVDFALQTYGLTLHDVEQHAGENGEVQQLLERLEATRPMAIRAAASVMRALQQATEKPGGWRAAAWLWENVWRGSPIIPPPSERRPGPELAIVFDD